MGELPATDLERSGSKEMARKFFKEMEEKATGFVPFGRRKRDLRDLVNTGGVEHFQPPERTWPAKKSNRG